MIGGGRKPLPGVSMFYTWRVAEPASGRYAGSNALFMVEKISAVTLRVANMEVSVRFYKDVLGLETVYGGERSYFTSLRTKDGDTILNLERGSASIQWGRLIFHVSDVDRFWAYLMEKGFHPDTPHDASWGERYFHMPDPDGHELSFARPF